MGNRSIKKFILALGILLSGQAMIYAQDAYHLRMLGNWNNPSLATNPNIPGQIWSELTGYVDSASHKEYIIMGSIDSVYFFDVSNPSDIRLCDVESGLNRATNRDVEILGHYVYCVSDNAPAGKLQIYDLAYLPDSVHKVYESDTLGHNTHSIFINKESKRLYMCINRMNNNTVRAMDVISLEKPDSPAYMATLVDPTGGCERVHEAYVRHDTAYCSCEYKGLFVFDMTDLDHIKSLGAITPPYPYNGYNHTSWPDSSNEFIAFTDEVPNGLPAKIYRIRELNDMTYETHFTTHEGSTPHNVFWVGNKLYLSWYHDGVYIFSVDTPRSPKIYAFYDTYPQNAPGQYDGYRGCWGVYPFLPSGNIAASDMSNGLFMFAYDHTVGTSELDQPVTRISIYPNPFESTPTLNLFALSAHEAELKVYDLQGRMLIRQALSLEEGEHQIKLDALSALSHGIYFVVLQNHVGSNRLKVVKE